jgi:two-component system chemotaxis response regulator CheB
MIRVLVAEDSAAVRVLLMSILSSDQEIEVVGEAVTGRETVRLTERLRPDVITMDIHMPEMDGIEATEAIMSMVPTPIVIVSSAVRERDAEMSFRAMSVGALAALPKPEDPTSARFVDRAEQLVSTVKAMSQVKVVRHWSAERKAAAEKLASSSIPKAERGQHDVSDASAVIRPELESTTPGLKSTPGITGTSSTYERAVHQGRAQVQVIAIAASTGGPAALQQILSGLPRRLPVPILIVQHIADGFVHALTKWLGESTALKMKLAEDGETLVPGTVYIAPDGHHLGVRAPHHVHLSAEPPIAGFVPSANYLFTSVAKVYGAHAMGVIMTGMGNDGIEGLKQLRAAGGWIVAQDEASSVVYGMPQEAVRAGVVDEILSLQGIGNILRALEDDGGR